MTTLRQVAAVAELFRPEWQSLVSAFEDCIARGADWETWIALQADLHDERRRAAA